MPAFANSRGDANTRIGHPNDSNIRDIRVAISKLESLISYYLI